MACLICCAGRGAARRPKKVLTPEQKQNHADFLVLKTMFDLVDTDKNGLVSKEEIMKEWSSWGIPVEADAIKTMMAKYDTDNDGCLNFIELTKMMREFMDMKSYPLEGMFIYFDRNDDGKITDEEFVKAMRCCGIDMTDEIAKQMLPKYYSPGTHLLEYENFCLLMKEYLTKPIDEVHRDAAKEGD